MKPIRFFALVLTGVLFCAGANPISGGKPKDLRSRDTIFANSLANGGRVRMKHSPTLGINVPIAIRIDGVKAGEFSRGQVYEKYLTPGRHDLHAVGPAQGTGSWHGTLEVRVGEMYSFVVKRTFSQIILLPVSGVE